MSDIHPSVLLVQKKIWEKAALFVTDEGVYREDIADLLLCELEELSAPFQSCRLYDMLFYSAWIEVIRRYLEREDSPTLRQQVHERVLADTAAATKCLRESPFPGREDRAILTPVIEFVRRQIKTL